MSLNLLVYRKANWNIFASSTDQKQMESVYMYLWLGFEGKVYFHIFLRNKEYYRLLKAV